jgi:hypothetical protein
MFSLKRKLKYESFLPKSSNEKIPRKLIKIIISQVSPEIPKKPSEHKIH